MISTHLRMHLTYPNPSVLQTTRAAASEKKSPHTVPQVPLWSTSRRPRELEPPTSLTELRWPIHHCIIRLRVLYITGSKQDRHRGLGVQHSTA